jgi:hypothetical protein
MTEEPPPRCPKCTAVHLFTEPDNRGDPQAWCLACGWRQGPAELLGLGDAHPHDDRLPRWRGPAWRTWTTSQPS